jgi:hypothetical protein
MKRGLLLPAVLASLSMPTSLSAGGAGAEAASATDAAPPREVVETYAKKMAVQVKDVTFEKADLNGDGVTDWLVYSPDSCGSAGCGADVYAFISDRYCYVGTTRFGDAPDALHNKYHDLKCEAKGVKLKDPL